MIENNIKDLLFTRLKILGYHLIRVKIINASGKKTLQIMAERIKDREMDIKDCTFLSKQISSYLEVDDPISSSYILEVSSGGLDRPLTILDDYKWLKGNKVKIKFVKDRPGHDIRYALNSSKIKKKLKWKPKTSFKKGIEETFNWYLSNDMYYKSLSKKDILKRLGK